MRRAFTLIELLVVIAIIAILAAILFPVFAQAKIAAKKTTAISNQKQISLAILIYASEHDDYYPRNDDCVRNSSLNPALNGNPFNPVGVGCTTGAFYYRVNHFAWQKWLMPFTKNVDIFEHPLRKKDSVQWSTNGQIANSFAINLGFTGALDTYNRAPTFPRQFRDSWIGGTQTALPNPSEAALLMEMPIGTTSVVPPMGVDPVPLGPRLTVYPIAVREWWRYKFMIGTQADCIARTNGVDPDPLKAPAGGLIIGRADGGARYMTAQLFLTKTPTKAEIFGTPDAGSTSGYTFGSDCGSVAGNVGVVNIIPNINYPMWGLAP